jgi:hypothetical protein
MADLSVVKQTGFALLGPPNSAVRKFTAYLIVWNLEAMPVPNIYPTLIGLGFSVVKRPIFYNARAVSGSGWQVGVGYADTPTWEWDLTYDVLLDVPASLMGATANGLKKILGFYLGQQADLIRFLFPDPDDNQVTAQPIGTGDGLTATWTLVRSYGSGETGTENIGYLNLAGAFNVYLNGVLQSGCSVANTPGQVQLTFGSAPTSGQVITVDMSYYYYVHFKDPTNDFEKFADKLWTLKKVTLESLRG